MDFDSWEIYLNFFKQTLNQLNITKFDRIRPQKKK